MPWGHLRVGQIRPTPASRVWKSNSFERLYIEKRVSPDTLFTQGCSRSCCPRIHFTMLSHLGIQKPMWSWSPGLCYMFELAANLSIVHMMLILQAWIMQVLWGNKIYLDCKEKPGRVSSVCQGQNPSNDPWDGDVTLWGWNPTKVETPGCWRY
jgi:hypothetical protein